MISERVNGVRWTEFERIRPDLAAAGRRLFYQHGLGLGFLGTVRPDGGPRVHPMCPILTPAGLFALIVQGPKLADLRRDPRYAMHCETCPPPRVDDAFYITGIVQESLDRTVWDGVARQFLAERNLTVPWEGFESQALFEFFIDRCLVTLTDAEGGLPKGHTIWHASRPASN
ncbi:hypothetical protein BH18ACT15_BH18ACT15_02880 [soil metagenome]